MRSPWRSSSGRRFFRRLGFSFVQAAIFGSLLGVMVYHRLPRGFREDVSDDELSWHQRIRAGLDRLEMPFYDWRARSLGERSQRSDEVVVVAVDAETLSNARQAESPAFGVQPWPRELTGALVAQMVKEGAPIVVLDWLMADASPVGCRPVATDHATTEPSDDVGLRTRLDAVPDKTVLGFGWRREHGPPTVAGLYPYLLLVGRAPSTSDSENDVRRVLAQRRPVFVIPEAAGVQIWAGVGSEEDGHKLATTLGVKGGPQVRVYAAHERIHQVSAVDLTTALSEVRVAGLDVELLSRARTLEPPFPPLIGSASRFGALRVRADPDGVVRSLPLLVAYEPQEGQTHVLPAAPLVVAMQLAGSNELRYEKGMLRVGSRFSIPMEPSGHVLVRWDANDVTRDAKGTVRRALPAWRIIVNHLDSVAGRPTHYDNDLDGRVVVFTQTAGQSGVGRLTPVGRAVPEGAILAQSIVNLLRSEGLRRAEPTWDLVATFILAFLGSFLALTFSGAFRSTVGALVYFSSVATAAGGYLFIAHTLFIDEGVWVAVAGPLIAMGAAFFATTGYVFRTETQLRDFVYGTLGRYVSPELARRVHRDLSLMRPERRLLTVCACDLEGFTYRTRDLPPELLAAFLGEYLGAIGDVVRRTGGLMDRYGGDQIVAFWGAPLPNPRHAIDACAAALEIRALVLRRAPQWQEKYGIEIRQRIAVVTGEAVVGEIDATIESSYSIIGGVVSLATALTKSNATYGTRVLVSETTATQAGTGFAFREADRMFLRADKRPTVVFQLLGRTELLTDAQKGLLRDFSAALAAYHERKFEEARALFVKCAEEHTDTLSKLYSVRAEHYLKKPPPPEWDQVYEQRAFPGA